MAIKLKEIPALLVRNYVGGCINTFFRGKPAMGKTESIEAFAAQMQKRVPGFKLWRFYAPSMSPMDIQASAPDYERNVLVLFNNQALPNAYTDPDAQGVLFLGELPNADQSTTKLLQKYINGEDMSGVLRKPAGVMVVADGNRIEDKSTVQQQGRAFMSRFEQIEVYSDASDNIDYAAKHAWHPLVQTFFKDNPALIDNYDEVFETKSSTLQRQQKGGDDQMTEEGKVGIWANMRAWERISKKEYAADELGSPVTHSEAVGNLGSGVAAKYSAHKAVMQKLASFEDIMADPVGVALPAQMDEQYALAMVVALRCSEDQMPAVAKFGRRLPLEMQAVILRNLATRAAKGDFDLATNDAYTKWIASQDLVKLING